MKKEYVLRAADEREIERLRYQHEVWKAPTQLAIEKSGLHPGDSVIDLGCGAGYLSFDLAKLVGEQGKVYALDNSEKFLSFIQQKKVSNIHTILADIRTSFPAIEAIAPCDKIFCRWVLMFTGEVEKIVDNCYQRLKEGGKFISIEYFKFEQIDIFPASSSFQLIYEKVQELLRLNGGDPNVGNELYQTMAAAGFKNIETYPIYRIGKPGTELWNWLEKTSENHVNLVEANLISTKELEWYAKEWELRSKLPYSFLTAPPLMITIGEK